MTASSRFLNVLLASKPPPNLNFAQQPMSSILKAGLPPQPRPAALPARYAVVAAAAVTPTTTAQATPTSQVPPTPTATSQPAAPTAPSIPTSSSTGSALTADQTSAATSSPSLTHPSLTSPLLSSAASAAPADGSIYSAHDSPALSEAVPSSVSGPVATSSPQRIIARTGIISFYSSSFIAYLDRSGCYRIPSCTASVCDSCKYSSSIEFVRVVILSQCQQQVLSEPQPQVSQPTTNGASQATSVPPTQEQISSAVSPPTGVPIISAGPSSFPQSSQLPATPQYPPGVRVSEQPSAVGQQLPPQSIRPPSAAPQQVLVQQPQPPRTAAPNAFPGSLSDLVMSFENVKQKGESFPVVSLTLSYVCSGAL